MTIPTACLTAVLLHALCVISAYGAFDETKFTAFVTKIEGDALAFAKEVERLLSDRCLESTYTDCEGTNYDHCISSYPDQQCLAGPNYVIPQCSGENLTDPTAVQSCSAMYDFSISTCRIPAALAKGLNANPTDPAVLEALCSTRSIDIWLRTRRVQDALEWKTLGLEPRAWYFGSTSGAFRIWPARHSAECGQYDPRVRPWYVAGGSGPKNVVLIIDTSGSMENGNRIDNAKEAAIRIVSTLTSSDRVTIISFADSAQAIADENGLMFRAKDANKELLIEAIKNLTASGETNFGDAFDQAFSVFNNTINAEREASCNSAILFLTDGVRRENESGMSLDEVTNLVTTRMSELSSRLGKPIFLLTYSISENSEIDMFPSQLACAVENGVWTKITDSSDILPSLSAYYKLFAIGLGTDANKKFVAWTEPYKFNSGNILGTTVSVPVYDRNQTPHSFLGVVGVDVALQGIVDAVGGTGVDESIARIVRTFDTSCPPELNLSKCQLHAWGQVFDSAEGPQCGTNCTENDYNQAEKQICAESMPYPTNIFANFDLTGVTYESRACCKVETSELSDQCPIKNITKPDIGDPDGGTGSPESSSFPSWLIGVLVVIGVIVIGVASYFVAKPRVCPPPPPLEFKPSFPPIGRGGLSRASAPPLPPPPPPFNPDASPEYQNAEGQSYSNEQETNITDTDPMSADEMENGHVPGVTQNNMSNYDNSCTEATHDNEPGNGMDTSQDAETFYESDDEQEQPTKDNPSGPATFRGQTSYSDDGSSSY
ncbi:hypothetical protein ACA910_019967 [Epithemia clementina (nom. ined.)]